jgi:N-acetylglucosamine-6-sulfatase
MPSIARLVTFIAVATLLTALPARAEDAPALPNIVFILVDDMRWDQLGATGHPFAQTPNLDRIAAEGVTFTNAFVTTPLCSPSRASFLTGQYAHTHRILNNDRNGLALISHKLVTFPQLLRRKGYETAFIGKWHMGDDDTRRPGFDHWISFKGQGLFRDPVVNKNGIRRQHTGYMTDLLNVMAVDYVKRKRDKPFVLILSHKAVHRPFLPAPRHEELYADEAFTPPDTPPDDLAGKPVLGREVPRVDPARVVGASPEPSEPRYGRGEDRRDIYLDHNRCLASVDDGVGYLLDTLEAKGELDNTLIVFASDNGFLFGEHGEFMNKRVAYEESLRIPLLMRYPRRIPAGTMRDQLVLNVDLAPTLYDLAGVKPPVPVHGKSLLPVLEDGDHALRDGFLAEHFLELVSPKHPEWQAVRTRDWKYIHYPTLEGMDELYDLTADPKEIHNLIDTPKLAGTRSDLETRLADLLAESGG